MLQDECLIVFVSLLMISSMRTSCQTLAAACQLVAVKTAGLQLDNCPVVFVSVFHPL